jgi:hypothetical protein
VTDRLPSGTGFGLRIVHDFADATDLQVEASESGDGSARVEVIGSRLPASPFCEGGRVLAKALTSLASCR